ncbi:MAG TPA: glycosyltransferase family 4 protein [Stenomitos sp.]
MYPSYLASLANLKESQRNILIVSRVFLPDPGGIQEYVYNRCLQDRDQVIVLSAACPESASFDQIQPFPIHRWSGGWVGHIKGVGGFLKQMLYMFWEVFWGIALFFRYRYRAIEWAHGYDFPAILVLSYLLPIRFSLYLHGDDVLCPLKNKVFAMLFEWTLRRAAAIACNSTFTCEVLKSHFRFDTPIHIIYPTVRPEKFGNAADSNRGQAFRAQVRNKFGISESSIVILSVGRLVRRKGFDRILDQMPRLLAAGIDVYYIICGTGPLESELRTQAHRLDVDARTIFAGYVPDDELACFYWACDIFALATFFEPKARSIEGFGIVYLEAGLFSKPVVASRSGGVEDAVKDAETGILVDPNATDAIFDALFQLANDPQLRHELGRNGCLHARSQPSFQVLYQNSPASFSASSHGIIGP